MSVSVSAFGSAAAPLVSALVHSTRTPKDAVACVRSLLKQTIADRLEIILIDNHSEDDSIGIFRNTFGGHPLVRIVETKGNLGFGRGNNLGARYATGEYLLIINPDTTLRADALERMLEILRHDPLIGILAPRLEFDDGTVRDSYRTFPTILDIVIKRSGVFQRLFHRRLERYLQRNVRTIDMRDTDWVAGGCIFLHMDLYRKLGGFDERFFLFFEDTDLCRRCWEAGQRVVYCPSIRAADSKQRLSGGGFFSIFFRMTGRAHLVSAVKYFWKWRGKPLPRVPS
ncbi:MAG: glycosyltransferase family 2 protein [Candidatus Peregrinibacteria bacterium]